MYVKSPSTYNFSFQTFIQISWKQTIYHEDILTANCAANRPFVYYFYGTYYCYLIWCVHCTRCCITDDGTKKNHHKKNDGLFFTYFFNQCYKSLLHMCICNYFFHKIPQRPLFGVSFKNFFKNLILAFSDYIVPITSTFSNLKRSDNVYKLFIQIIITQIYA